MNWKSVISEMPEKEHIQSKTQFLLKGFYQFKNVKGGLHYAVCYLADYLPDGEVQFDTPVNYVVTHWSNID